MIGTRELEPEIGGYDPTFYADLYRAEDTHFWFRARNRLIAMLAREYTAGLGSYYVLEAGCGGGNVTRTLQDVCRDGVVVGVDLFAEGLVYARQRGVRNLVQADIAQSPFRNSFHLAGMFDVLEHIPDDAGTLWSLSSALRKDGRLLLTVPAHQELWSYFDDAALHSRRYNIPHLRQLLNETGFEVEYMTEFMSFTYPFVKVKRWWTARYQKNNISAIELARRELLIHPSINWFFEQMTKSEAGRIRQRKQLGRGTSILAIARKAH